MTTRKASHAGSWYSAARETLDLQLRRWLEDAGQPSAAPARAIIAPHAGYSFSGSTAGFAYKQVQTAGVRRVFLLGPSHHVYVRGCALSGCAQVETPLGPLSVDQEICAKLKESGMFETMALSVDEAEHR